MGNKGCYVIKHMNSRSLLTNKLCDEVIINIDIYLELYYQENKPIWCRQDLGSQVTSRQWNQNSSSLSRRREHLISTSSFTPLILI